MRSILILTVPAILLPLPVLAQTAAPEPDRHRETPDTIVVTGAYAREQGDVLGGTSVIAGEELTRALRPSIGETLARQPGVSATSFGPTASRPVLRGFQGERIRLLTDGIGAIDASNTSVDHAPVINPLTADRIEVLRGPSALQFGSSAIGGVVNVIDSRIPRRVPQEPVHADLLATYGSAAEERSVSSAVDVPVARQIVLHLDGSYSKTADLDTGGYILSPALRGQAAASADPEIRELAERKGRLPNSAARTWEAAGGIAVVNAGGNLGVSFSHHDSLYGVPVRYSLDPAFEAEAVRIQLKQDRVDMRGEVRVGGGLLDTIRLRVGAADYTHAELEEDGAVGTRFFNQGYEGRLELVQANRGGWQGAVGGQFFLRDFEVEGDEKFLPRNGTEQFGLFTLQSYELGAFRAEAGARYEHQRVHAFADSDLGNPDLTRSFDSVSGSLGGSYAVAQGLRLGLNLSRSERAPSAEELFANGPHAGTQAYEIGSPDFSTEKSWGVEASLKGRGAGWSFSGSAFYNWFTDYIYDARTGAVIDDLPVYQYRQGDARYWGLEGEASMRLARAGDFAILADALADYVRATVADVGPVAHIPPLRMLWGLEAQSPALDGRVEVEKVFRQSRVAENETETPGYAMVNASLNWKPFGDHHASLLLSVNNLFDVTARRHASFLKDYAPLAGRDIRVTARFTL